MASAPIILVPGFWLGAWAWDEVAAIAPRRRPRRDGADAARSRVGRRRPVRGHVRRPRRRDRRGGRGGRRARRARRPQRDRVHRVRRERPRPGADRGDGLRRHRAREGRRSTRTSTTSRSRWSGRRSWRRRTSTGSARSSWRPSASAAVPVPGCAAPRGAHADQRRAPRHPRHDHRDRLHVRGLPEGRRGASGVGVPRRHPGAARTSPGSTCRRATGRCGRARPSSRAIIGDVATHAGDAR